MRFSTIISALAGLGLAALTSAVPIDQSDAPCREAGATRCANAGSIQVCIPWNRGLYWRWARDCDVGTYCQQRPGGEAVCLSPAPALFCIVGSPVCLNKATEGGEAVEGYEVAEDEDAISTESISSEKAINDHATTMKDAVATNDVAIADDSATEGDDSAIKRDIGKEQWIDNTCTWPGQERCGTLGTIEVCTEVHNRLVWLWAADCMPGMICVQPLGETTRCQALAFTPNICMISGICPSKAVKGEDGAAEGDKEAVEGEDSAQDAKENTSA